MTYLNQHLSAGFMQQAQEPGPGCIKPTLKCPFKKVAYKSVMGTLTGVAWSALSTLVSFCFTWLLTGSLKGTRNLDIILYS